MPSKIYLILRSERSERLALRRALRAALRVMGRRIVMQPPSAALTISSQPRKPESMAQHLGARSRSAPPTGARQPWTPASAGVTAQEEMSFFHTTDKGG